MPAARWAIRKGLSANALARLDEVYLRGVHPPEQRPSMGHQVSHSANVDSLAYHLGILGVAYLVTDQYLRLMQPLTADLAPGGIPIGLIFSHNYFFVHGMLVCLAMRSLLDRLGYGHVIDAETKKRITGTAVDFMMICSILSVQFGLLSEFLVPIVLITGGAVGVTAGMCYLFSRSLSTLQPERVLAML